MHRRRLVRSVMETHFGSFRKSQRTTIAALVTGLLVARRVGLASIARGMEDLTTVRHRIKRAWRFTCNRGVHHEVATEALVGWLLGSCESQQKHPVLIALDWTTLGNYWMLAAKIVVQRRAVPVAWRIVTIPQFSERNKSRNQLEEDLIMRLQRVMGPRRWILLADRGFARADLFAKLNKASIQYVVRVSSNVWVETRSHRGKLDNIMRRPSRAVRYTQVLYQKTRRVPLNLVVTHREPAPEPWYLVTNADAHAREVARYYERRMGVEEGFRDAKSGLGLKHLWLATARRMERMMVLVAVAMALSVLAGMDWRRRFGNRDPQLTTKRRGGEISVFRLGLERLRLPDIDASMIRNLCKGIMPC